MGRMSLPELLARVVADRVLHARLLNTLSRMEYVGARKILKSRRAEDLDADGLQHVLEEVGHALRLKRAATQLAAGHAAVETYENAHTLAGDIGERYVQGVDAAAAEALADLPAGARVEANYLLTSVAIEIRAEAFYAAYDRVLERANAPLRVASIYRDELRHLTEMKGRLAELLPSWRARLAAVSAREEVLYEEWMRAVDDETRPSLRGGTPASAPAGIAGLSVSREQRA